ncbi:hypothetical protein [Colwellia sp. 20A7]|uniref:hypothetical protein n=1 Tax=Colwellia sp. 20A7 TaxID=2689569 RepID=UPI00135C36F5|nr:hypothetical protein [Colwellia sp. 20A7]
MMMNIDYTSIIDKARTSGATRVDFNNASPVKPIDPISSQQDTVTLSKQALALMNGDNATTEEAAPTYIKPETASSLLAQNETTSAADIEKSEKAIRFEEIMQSVLDQRTGIDRDKLAEIDAMIEEVQNNEDMSPEEKEKTIEMLGKMKEEIIEGSIELQKIAKQTDKNKEDA